MKNLLRTVLFVIYSIIAITVTVLLLSFNDYNCSEIGGYTVYIVKDDALEPEFKQGSILLIKTTSDKNIQIGDSMLLYQVHNSQEYEVVHRTLVSKAQSGRHITYTVENNETYASDYFIGKTDDTVVIEGWGVLLSILESRWGYLFCIVIVSLLLFLQEVFELVVEIKYGGGKAEKKAAKAATEAVEVEAEEVTSAPRKRTTTRTASTATTKTATVRKTTTGTATKTSTARTSATRTSAPKKTTTTTARAATAKKAVKPTTKVNKDAETEEG